MLVRASNHAKERTMLRTTLAAIFISLFMCGPAFAGTAVSGQSDTSRSDTSEKEAGLSRSFSVLHAVAQWATKLSEMAEQRAKSDLVKDYARAMTITNAKADAKLQAIAEKHGIAVVALDPQTEEGKSVLDRMKAEMVLLGSLQGDAFDKEYMTLVTNTQQSVINLLKTTKASAKDPDVKQFIGELMTTVQSRLKKAQDIMAKVYGNNI
jgi:putative membrane protein